ncbi:hypothetical protein [Clostridium sp. JS66]|uniref:DUF6630 family protein n=1 Tax=Clostridium sp. JS66 TaxID=3064705 RepID=UPI00298D8DAE|nr:hypothetical protein [Clostridium sp. JS66]WPC42646.1 hypothetical protein Q6H37_04020 [Clostridium sp. JS66]
MPDIDIVRFIFEDSEDIQTILGHSEEMDLHEAILEHGISTKRFLCIDYKGEHNYEIVNYILDYEFNNNIELGSEEELEELDEFEYEFLPDKIREVNKVISKKGYGLFAYPTFSDFYALFIDKLEKKTKLLQVEFNIDELIPYKEKFIQYYI